MSKKAIIIGATSGIGRALAKKFHAEGYETAATGRRLELLEELSVELGAGLKIRRMDVRNTEESVRAFEELVEEMNGVDVVIYNSGVNDSVGEINWRDDFLTTQTNALGFVAIADHALRHFLKQGSGRLVGISSITALRGNGRAPAYSASKAYMSNYMAGLRQRLAGTSISVSDIRPGYVRTAMLKDHPKVFWAAEPEKAAGQIYDAIMRRKKVAYVTKRWAFIAFIIKCVPDFIYDAGFSAMFRKKKALSGK